MNVSCFFGPFPVLDLGDIVLREITLDDAQAYLDYMMNDYMTGFLTKESRPFTLEKAVQDMDYWGGLFHKKYSIYWAIALKSNNMMIGTAGFNSISFANARADISYDLDPNYWGKGIMLKSVKGIVDFADNVLRLVRIQATVIKDNHRSIKLLERCNFEKEGFLKKYEVVENEHKDYYMYARVF